MRRVEAPLIAVVALLVTVAPAFVDGSAVGAALPRSTAEWLGWSALIVSALSLTLWRQHPAWTVAVGCTGLLAASLTSLEVSNAALILLPCLALLAAWSWSGPTAVVVGLGLLGWLEAFYFTTGESGPALAIFAAPGYVAGVVLRRLQETAAQLEIRSRELEEERELFAELSVRNERSRIASELHDIIGHALSVMVVQAAAGQRAPGGDAKATARAFAVIADSARQGREDLARLMDLLAGDAVMAADLSLIDEVVTRAARSGIAVTCRFEGDCDSIPAPIAHAMFRVVQEGLTNAIRHAPGAAVRVLVRGDGHALTVRVVNDSPVASPTKIVGAGHGLPGLRERVQRLNGALTAGTITNGGWALEASLPHG